MYRSTLLCTFITLCVPSLTGQEIPDDVNPVTTKQGLKYSVLKRGDGRQVALGDKLWLRYTGWLEDGKIFDTGGQEAEGKEVELIPGRVTGGWLLGLTLMKVGDVFKFTLPPELGYGNRARQNVPASSTLIYQIEVLKAEPFLPLPKFKKLDDGKAQKTDSGLRYEVLVPGSGEIATLDDPVTIRYALWNKDGVFVECNRASVDGPISFLPRNIRTPFFKQAIAMMKPGARWRFEAPPELVFGGRPYGPFLPPDSTTYWELELLQVVSFVLPKADELKTTESGLKYKVVKEGTGRTPKASDKVRVHYSGWLLNGTRFDSSYERSRPAEFPLGGVVKGWTEGLQLMKEGGIRIFLIPPELGYGDKRQAKIPPGSTLCFRVHLLKVLDK